jgi:hypothetical protein
MDDLQRGQQVMSLKPWQCLAEIFDLGLFSMIGPYLSQAQMRCQCGLAFSLGIWRDLTKAVARHENDLL